MRIAVVTDEVEVVSPRVVSVDEDPVVGVISSFVDGTPIEPSMAAVLAPEDLVPVLATGVEVAYNPFAFIVWTGEHFVAVENGVYLHV